MTSEEPTFVQGIVDDDSLTSYDMLYQPNAKMKYVGHRNSRYHILANLRKIMSLQTSFIEI